MGNPFYNKRAWRDRARKKALIAGNSTCVECGARVTGKRAQVDHIFELKHHPLVALEPANLRVLCVYCHNRRHGRGRYGCTVDGMPLDPNHPWNRKICRSGGKDSEYYPWEVA